MALTLIVHARVPQKRLRPKGEDFSMIFDEIEPAWQVFYGLLHKPY